MGTIKLGAAAWLRGAGSCSTRALALALAIRLVTLGSPVALAAAPPEGLDEVWARARQVGYEDGAACLPQTILHGCPQPASPDPALGARYERCAAEYAEGYRAGEADPRRRELLDQARAKGADDAAACRPMTNVSTASPCSAEWERTYRAAYGLPGERCRLPSEQRRAEAAQGGVEAIAGAPAVPPEAASAPAVQPSEPAEAPRASPAKASSRDGGPSMMPVVVGLGVGLGVGAYFLGKSLAGAAQKSCNAWANANCPSVPGGVKQTSDGLCHCCVPICSGTCYCMACGAGCGGAYEMCVDGTCVFRAGGSP